MTDVPAAALKQLFATLFDDESAIIVVVNPENEVLDYRVEPLSEIVALLALSGFGQPASVHDALSTVDG